MRTSLRLIVGAAVLLAVLPLAAIVHEGGHVAAGAAVGRVLREIAVLPGLRLYPAVGWTEWDGWIARVIQIKPTNESPRADGFVDVMGAGSTALVAYVAAALAWWQRPRGPWLFFTLVVLAVFGGDLLAYGTLPRLGLRHALFIGGESPEPRDGALALGIPGWAFDSFLAVHAATLGSVALLAMRSPRRQVIDEKKLNPTPRHAST